MPEQHSVATFPAGFWPLGTQAPQVVPWLVFSPQAQEVVSADPQVLPEGQQSLVVEQLSPSLKLTP